MFKSLLKKQMMEINKSFFQDVKTGNSRSKASTIKMIVGFGVLVLLLALMFGVMAYGVALSLVETEYKWLYFTTMGSLAILLGVFGGVFNTYSSMYQSKDNELLLSMPIPVRYILFIRLTSVYLMGLLYSSIIMVPSLVVYYIVFSPTVGGVFASLLLYFLITIFVLVLCCLLGFLVAKLTQKIKNKTFITVIVSLLFFIVYYYFCFNASSLFEKMIANGEVVTKSIKAYAYPFYLMGEMGLGSLKATLILFIATTLLFALCFYIISKTYIKITTTKTASVEKVSKDLVTKQSNYKIALLKRELKRFFSSSTYMLNCGFGVFIMMVGAVFMLIKPDAIVEISNGINILHMNVLFLVGIIMLVASTVDITAPSVSLEGKNIWIIRTLPIKTIDILNAKILCHLVVTLPFTMLFVICGSIGMHLSIIDFLICMLVSVAYVVCTALFGLCLNLKSPNLNWVNETVVIKQGVGIFLSLFGGWMFTIAILALYFAFMAILPVRIYLLLVFVLISVISLFLYNYIRYTGKRQFEKLN